MNQILVTKKLYITPELKRKKKIYKLDFFLSIFLVCILISVCIYAEYDKGKSEEVSQEILANVDIAENSNNIDNDKLIVVLNDVVSETEERQQQQKEQIVTKTKEMQTTGDGYKYETIATINIPKINVEYAIIEGETKSIEETDALLKMSPTKFWGANPNEVGNFCIVGHNYRNNRFFSKVPNLKNGDSIYITDVVSGKKIEYSVYNNYNVNPKDISCIDQNTNGRKEITLITCTDDSKLRVIIKAVEVK